MPTTVFVRHPRQSSAVRERLMGVSAVAVDCEAAGFHRYSDRLCLVQLSTPDETFVLDPLALDLTPLLKTALEEPGRRTIMHGGSFDLRLLQRDLGVQVKKLSDTQVAATFLGEPAIGLQSLLDKHLGVRLSKKFQRADWAKRPLSREMIEYGAGDTRYLHRLDAVLTKALEDLGRTAWAEEECERLVRSSVVVEPQDVADPVTRVKGARALDLRSLAVLREMLRWRDMLAREMDRALFRVASDAALLAVAVARPRTVEELAQVKGFSPQMARFRGTTLLKALRRAETLPRDKLLPWPKPRRRGLLLSDKQLAAFDLMKEARTQVALSLGIERGRLMAKQLLRKVAAGAPASLGELQAIEGVRRWQVELLGDALLRALRRAGV